MKKFKLATSN